MSLPPPKQNEASGSQPFSTERYFQTQRPPPGLEQKTVLMNGFVQKWQSAQGKRVVLVTVSSSLGIQVD